MIRDSKQTVLCVFACVFPTILTWIYFVYLRNDPAYLQKAVYGVGKLLQFVVLPSLLGASVRSLKGLYKIPTARQALEATLSGLLAGGAILFSVFCILKGSENFVTTEANIRSRISQLNIESPSTFLIVAFFYALFHSGLEEFYWRGIVDRWARNRFSNIYSLIISSLCFASHHYLLLGVFVGFANPLAFIGSVAVAGGGAYWAWCDRRFLNIMPSWISHAIVDAALFLTAWKILFGSL